MLRTVVPLAWTNSELDYKNLNFVFHTKNKKTSSLTSLEAAIFTVNYICDNYPAPYTLCLSGGVDSQAMLYAWLISGKPFNTFCARYNNNLNDYDLKTLEIFAQQHNININYYDFDLFSFLEQEHDFYARTYHCGSPQITSFMKFCDIINNGTMLFSGNFLAKGYNGGISDRNNMGLYHFSTLSKQSVVPFFLAETEELAYSFNEIKNLDEILSNNNYYQTFKQEFENFLNSKPMEEIDKYEKHIFNDYVSKEGYFMKCGRYLYNGYPVIPQDKKYNGFERVKIYFDNKTDIKPKIVLHKLIDRDDRIPAALIKSKRNFDILYRNSYEKLLAKHKYCWL